MFLILSIAFFVISKPIKEENITYIETTVLVADSQLSVIFTEELQKFFVHENTDFTDSYEELNRGDWIKIGYIDEQLIVYLESESGVIFSVWDYNSINKREYITIAIITLIFSVALFCVPFFKGWSQRKFEKIEKKFIYKYSKKTKTVNDPQVIRSNMFFERNYWHLDIDKLDERINYSDAQTACFYDLLSDGKAEVILCCDKMPN